MSNPIITPTSTPGAPMSSLLALEGCTVPEVAPSTVDFGVDALATRLALHIESLVPRGRPRCLDVACGDVMLAEEIRVRTSRAEWCCADVLDVDRLPYGDGEFDVALLCDVLRDEREDAARARLLAEVGRVAKCVLVHDRFEDGERSPTLRRGDSDDGGPVSDPGFTREAFVRLAADQRFRIMALDADFDVCEPPATGSTVLRQDGHFIAVLGSA